MKHNALKRSMWTARLALVALLLVPMTAFADTVTNNVTAGGNDTITAGGSTTIQYTLNATNNDGQNGCNANGANPATMSITKPAAVTGPSTVSLVGCGNAVSVTYSSNTVGNYAISVSVSGGRGGTYNTTAANFTLKVLSADTTPPTLNLPGAITAEATSAAGAAVAYDASATDAVDGAVAITCVPASGSTFALGTTTVNCSAKDSRNNTANGSFTVTVKDTQAPQISNTPADIAVEAENAAGAVVSYTAPTAIDLVDGTVAVTCTPASGSTFSLGSAHTVTCSATDSHNNTNTKTFTILVKDTKAPVLALGDVSAEATGPNGAMVSYTAKASDLVDGDVTPTCAPVSGSTFAVGTTTVNCSASDAAGNTSSGFFTVTVKDTTAPDLVVPADATLEATGPNGATFSYSASASDLVDGSVAVSCAPASGSTFALGATEVTCSAHDAHNNSKSKSFTVTVVDTTAPSLNLPANATVEATSPGGAVFSYSASASDLVDGSVAVSCLPISGATFALGATEVTCSAHDAHNNIASKSFTVTVVDTTAPSLNLPADATLEATEPNGAAFSYSASASDVVDGSVAVSCAPASGSTFALGATTVNCSASDDAGNSASGSFKITVVDTTAPVLSLPANKTVEATGPNGAAASFTASASDLVDGSVAVSCTPASGSTFALGTTTVNCSATDTAGNKASKSFMVSVVDTTAPELSLPANKTVEATGPNGAAVSFTASASDLVDGSVAVSCAPASGSTFALGATTVSCSASDATGNGASGNFKITVVDTTAPANISFVGAIAPGAVFYFGDVPAAPTCTATDAVGVVSCTVTGYGTAIGSYTLLATAKDAAGNSATASLNYTVRAWSFGGFYQPVDMSSASGTVYNTVKSGSTVPLKFELFKGSTEVTSTSAIKPLSAALTTCSSAPVDDVELTATGGTALRYDTTGGQFIYNWQTPSGKAGSCYRVTITSLDGSSLSAYFKLK